MTSDKTTIRQCGLLAEILGYITYRDVSLAMQTMNEFYRSAAHQGINPDRLARLFAAILSHQTEEQLDAFIGDIENGDWSV